MTESRDLSNPRSITSREARELADALIGRGEGFVVGDQPLGRGVQGVHDAACDTFALAAASIGDHVCKESLFPWALALRLSALMIKLAEIVALAETELRKAQESSVEVSVEARPKQAPVRRPVERDANGNTTSVVESRSS